MFLIFVSVTSGFCFLLSPGTKWRFYFSFITFEVDILNFFKHQNNLFTINFKAIINMKLNVFSMLKACK